MFIADLPAGYLISDLLAGQRPNRTGLIATGLVASALPDTDLIWFYLIDTRQTPHHVYFFHWPLFWLTLTSISAIVARVMQRTVLLPYILTAAICLLVHMALDSFAAEIYWLKPFSDMQFNAVVVPARFDGWVWNFVWHWTFLVELLICSAAALVYLKRRRTI